MIADTHICFTSCHQKRRFLTFGMSFIRERSCVRGNAAAPRHHIQIQDGAFNGHAEAGFLSGKREGCAVSAQFQILVGECEGKSTLQYHERAIDVLEARERPCFPHLGNADAPVEILEIGTGRPDRNFARDAAAILPGHGNAIRCAQDCDHGGVQFFIRIRAKASQAASTIFRIARNFALRVSE